MFVTLTYSVYMKENRDISIKIRLTEAEKEQLLQRSKEEGKSLSSFIRESALKGRSISKTDVQMIYELRKIGANINQLAKHFERLPKERGEAVTPGKIVLEKCRARLAQADARELDGVPAAWSGSALADAIRQTLNAMPDLSNAIAISYFAHSEISRTGGGFAP